MCLRWIRREAEEAYLMEGRDRGGWRSAVIGIDIGGTKIAYAVSDVTGRLHVETRRPTQATDSVEQDMRRIAEEVRGLIDTARTEHGLSVAAVGVSVPGPLDAEQGVLLRAVNIPSWVEFPVRDFLRDATGLPVFLANDANAAALAEWKFGAARGTEHAIYLTMSTGIGAGLILNGALYAGVAGNAGELGHTVIDWNGELCGCGRRGCLEAYVSGKSLARRLRATTPETSRVLQLAGARDAISAKHLVAAAQEQDAFALAEMDRFNDFLAKGLANFVFAFAPEVIVLGTIATAAGEALCFEPLRKKTRALVWKELADSFRIVPSVLGEHLGPLAGACVALQGISEL